MHTMMPAFGLVLLLALVVKVAFRTHYRLVSDNV